ncbi:E3 ubiquitin-protein ligase RNF213 isoform X2 [Opisthocomus hoazin]|uniref:E3 ubiquitin-protein ligase RNF213 isoform X2 n=1 Tax=Opisthocomus hoazin TaxID=30419 RepID=UPI003F52FB99
MEHRASRSAAGDDAPGPCSKCGAQRAPGPGDKDPERREGKLTPVPDTGAESGGDVKGQGAEGLPPTTETKQEEGGSLMENARAWIGAPESTAEHAAGGPPSSADTREEREEGASLLEGVTAPSGSSEAAARRVAGDSSGKSRKRKKKRKKGKKDPSISGEQESLPPLSTAAAQSPKVPDACVTAEEMQSPGGEAAKLGADVLGGGSGGTGGSGRVLGHSAKEAGSLEAVAEGSPSSVDVKTPPKQRGADNVAAPSPSSAAPKEKVGGGSTTEHRETVQGSVGGGSHAPDAGQLAESRADFQSSGSGEKAASTGERASLSSGPSPGTGAPGHTPAAASAERRSQDAQTPPAVRSSQAGKDQQDTGQKVSHSTRENKVAKEKKGTPGEKVREVTVKASPTKAPEAARIGAPESTAERAAGGPPSSADTREEREEGASLLEGVTAPSGSSEAAARRVAGDSSGKSRKRKKKRKKRKKDPSISGEQETLPPLSTAAAESPELPDACVTAEEMQSPGGEAAKLGADVLAGSSGGAGGSGRALGHSAKEAGSLEAVAEGSPSSVDVKTPPKQRGADNVAAPSPSPAAPKQKVGGGSTTEHRETVQGSVGGGSHAPDAGQLAESRADFQSSGSGEKAASTGERASLSSGPSPGTGAPGHTPAAASAERRSQDAQTPPAVRSSQAGKDQQDTGQKVSHSTRENEVAKEKKGTPGEKVREVTVKASPTKGPEGARKDHASAVTEKKQKRNQRPVDKVKESSVSRREGVTVYFHAILSKDFKLDPETHKVFIRAEGIAAYASWKDNICELHCTKRLEGHGYLIEGNVTLAKESVNKPIPYKYWVTCSGGKYEFIYKRSVSSNHVNRCLFIEGDLLSNGEWHQYDDIVCAEPSIMKNIQKIFSRNNNKDVVRGKMIAASIMLESIFSILGAWSPDNLRNFLSQLTQFYVVTSHPWVCDGREMPWTELDFGTQQVNDLLLKYMRKIARPFLAPEGAKASQEDIVIKSKLALGLTVLTVVEGFTLPALKDDLVHLCSLLCLDKVSQEAILEEINPIKKAFAAVTGTLASLMVHLTNLCQRCIDQQVDQWVWILPLLHFFAAPVQCDHLPMEEDYCVWLEGLPFAETKKNQDMGPLLQLMKEKKYLMEFDRTLVKSWTCVLPLESLAAFIKEFSSDLLAILQGVAYRLENVDLSWKNSKVVESVLKTLLCTLDEKQARALEAHSWQSCLTCWLKLHKRVCENTKVGPWFMVPATSAMIISKVAKLQPTAVPRDAVEEVLVVEVFGETLRHTQTWFRNALNQKLLTEYLESVTFSVSWEIQAWDEFVKISFPDEQLTERWRKTLLADLKRRIQAELPVHQILAYCCLHYQFTRLDSSIDWCFHTCAIEAVTAACQTQSNLLEKISSYNTSQFSQLVSTIIVKLWSVESGQSDNYFDEILHRVLTRPDIKCIFHFNGTNTKLLEKLTDEAKNIIATADSVFMSVAYDIQKGCILVKHLEEIFQHEEQFICIWEIKHQQLLREGRNLLQRDLKELLWRRREEVALLRKEKEAIGTFLSMCRRVQASVKVDVGEVESQYLEDLCSKRLNTVVNVGERPLRTYYSFSPELKGFAQKMHSFKHSLIFQRFWEEAAQKAGEEYESLEEEEEDNTVPALDLDNVFSSLIRPCFVSYERLYNDLRSGNLALSAVDRIFQEFTIHPEGIKTELNTICKLRPGEDRDWVDQRFEQIQQYHEMHVTFDAAKMIATVKESFNLSGDFSILENLLAITEKLESCETQKLDSISPELMKAQRLLQGITVNRCGCLRELAKQKEFVCWVREALKDMNELKVFVDLASISAGENDMDVDRVACFHDAVHGYSSLLYELRQESGFEDFMRCLKKLWRALDSDENLPKKLHASAQHLEWLKTVKESHGSVELSSLSLAAAINSRGIYVLGAPADGQKVSLDNVLHFTLPGSSGGNETSRKYTLAELRELQNKLMLMSVKGEQGLEVEKFSEIFSNVQRLAQAFIDLYSAGNMLFRSWLAHVYCSPERESRVLIDFSLGPIPVLEGQGDMAAVLPGLCKIMESFLEGWKSFMYEKRLQHFYLNYYTAEQLVYLCTELGQGMPSQDALMMLSFLKHNCTERDVLRVSGSELPPSSRQAISDFQVMLDGEKDLTAQLECIWDCYMNNMGSLLPNCLDIDTLGGWLKSLAGWESEQVTRDFPRDLLYVGQPNLITCPRSEVLASALAIYMNSPNQPLPTFDEVLLCTPQTTAEQVGLFLRRCFIPCSGGEKIYTMLYADELSYDVSCRAEDLFQHLQHYNSTYRLIILCNCEREHSYIPSVFSQYKVHMIPQRPLAEIQRYLQHHYRVAQPSSSAASVFKDNMCVGIVSSKRAGVGKSLYVKRLHERLQEEQPYYTGLLKTIRLVEPEVDEDKVLKSLLPFLKRKHQTKPMIFHFDITSSVQSGIPEFLFKLLVLQYLTDNNGHMWLRQKHHLYIIEILEVSPVPKKAARHMSASQKYNFFDVFPKVTCKSPKEVLEMETLGNQSGDISDPGMDEEEFCSEAFQRPFQYLKRFDQGYNLDTFCYEVDSVEGNPAECLQQFLLHCGIMDPSWSELRNFTWFLNIQLRDCEASVFCNPDFFQDTLQGFKNFVVTFMILMARDFATPSLNISDESSGRQSSSLDNIAEDDLLPFRIRKKWESEPHPYLFFNEDRVSMTFIGFHFQPNCSGGVDVINPLNGNIIKKNVMTSRLYKGLLLQRVPFNVQFDQLPRHEKLEKLCMVLGIPWVTDPDETYELTTDNVLKILAIEMRFRCNIPVVIMGETGCGKTRLIKFLCKLRRSCVEVENMKLVKVHGGTTAEMIYTRIKEAEALAKTNKEQHGLDTVLFFDEANTTEAISSIKEVLCDHTVQGKPLVSCSGLQIIAACNPYRKHTLKMIQRLELAGLGYRVKADETKDKLGSIPLRQLVYRVHALPPSMIPLVWDFGQLNNLTEKLYIQQIVQRATEHVPMRQSEAEVITEVLFASQKYMRQRDDECGFVSLRDVERCMEVFKWFHKRSELLLRELEKYLAEKRAPKSTAERNTVIWSLVLAVGVCYHASLEKKEAYRSAISQVLPKPYDTQKKILEEISLMQELFLSGVHLRDTIARNLALKENVFMMVICIELKIPLFLVGKPGSSKSLAKTIVADAMQGQAAHSDLFKNLKQIHLVSFQCSPLSTPEGIIGTFKHCARFQEGKNLEEYVSVVVLDEIGLAEDSPKMPLKTLHPLLEDGCIDDVPLPHKKVGFVGISNWALDPAKMNRGIFVSRGDPSKEELIESAKGICCSARGALQKVEQYFYHFADAYENICKAQDREFFGLRDYYSLIKMFFALAKSSKSEPTPQDIAEVVLRNFGGKDDVNALEIFTSQLPEKGEIHARDISRIELVRQNIYSSGQDGDCRYLLVLTENYAALPILQQAFFTARQQPEIIFGSSFPKDQEYTQICRNINRVKVCMETGQMVVLLNLQNLYESLYDALNQYYVYLADQKYVDLGLGTHRVKCRVHPKFRLIVIEEKDVVYKHFPIPLINRLEKHYLDISTVLDKGQRETVAELKKWVQEFAAANTEEHFISKQKYSPSDVFVGYHSNTCASVVLQTMERLKPECAPSELVSCVKREAQLALLNCATPDSVLRLCSSMALFTADSPANVYFKQQQHMSFADFLRAHIRAGSGYQTVFTEVTTFSRLLTSADAACLEREVQGRAQRPQILLLQQFDTEYSFLKGIRDFLDATSGNKVLIIQTDFEDGSQNAQLIASAKYAVVNELNKVDLGEVSVFVYFIMKLSRVEGGTSYVGFHGGLWQSVHIDDLRRSKDMVSDMTALQNLTISQVFCEDLGKTKVVALPVNGEQEENEVEVETPVPAAEHCEGEILDTTVLLRTCVQSAVGMLRDQNEDLSRSRIRIKILLGLLSKEDDLKASFLKITKARLSNLLRKQEENSLHPKNWVLREASNLSALQEAGTFRHTLWKRVQSVITPFLALLIAVIDRNGNLDLLVRPTAEWVTNLWMFIFSDTKLLTVPYGVAKNSSQPEIILVQNNMMVSAGVGNELPFSWRIKEYLDEMWLEAQYIQNTEDQSEKFVDIFQKTALGKFISALTEEERQMLFQCYITDFIVLTIAVSSLEELQCLRIAFLSCIEEWKATSPRREETVPSLPWVHLGYNQFKRRLQNFSRILAVHPCAADYLVNQEGYGIPHTEMVLDVLAAMVCAEELENQVQTARPEIWLQKVKSLRMPIEFLCKEKDLQRSGSRCHQLLKELEVCWNRIFSMSLFVEHVLLGIDTLMPEFENLVKKYTLLLAKCFQHDSDMKTHPTFVAVMKVLCECKNEVSNRLYRYSLMSCPICLGEPKDPVCLPCYHMFCQKCIRMWLVPAQMHCPYCRVAVGDVDLNVSVELRDAIARNAMFRQRCNNFFIDVVTTMCFKDNEPPDAEVIQELLNLLFVHRSLLKGSGHPDTYTKFLSPFNDEVDETPVIRSVMLKLLLKYSFNEVKNDVQHYLSRVEHNEILETNDKKELYLLFVNCLEDSMCEKSEGSLGYEHINYLPGDRGFPENYLPKNNGETPQESSVDYLQAVAKVRLYLSKAAELLFDLHERTEQDQVEEKQHYLENVRVFCSLTKNNWHRVYLVRKIASQYGIEFAQKLVTETQFNWVFPVEILQQVRNSQSNHIDRYLTCGENYRVLRDAVGKAMIECQIEGLLEAEKASSSSSAVQPVHLLLAIFREVTALYGASDSSLHPKQQQTDAMTGFIQSSQALSSPDLQHFATSLVMNALPSLTVDPQSFSRNGALIEMAVHTAAVLLCGQNPVLQPLQNLAFCPHTMEHSFLPTMPEDVTAQARAWQGMATLRWYTCPNGHACTVGECGRPMETSRCLDCGAPVGGQQHKSLPGFQELRSNEDRTQTGHVLGDAQHRKTMGVSDRAMSPVVFTLIRLLTHLTMLLGATSDPQSLQKIIKPPVDNSVSFLQQHIQEDLAQLTKILGKSVDETINILHLVLSSLLKDPHQHPGQWPVQFDVLSTKQKRNKWEAIVANTIIVPELEDLDKKLLKLNRQIQEDERISSNPVVKIVYGDPATFLSQLPKDSHIHHSKMWSCRKRISVENLGHVVQQKNAKDTVPVLWKFLQKETELRLVKFLPEILALQRDLVRRFQNTADVKHCSIRNFLNEPLSDVMRDLLQRRVNVFLSVWNKLRSSLDSNGEIKLPKGYCDAELTLDSKLEVLLPRRQGLGLCSTALASYLIGLHNDLIHSVNKHIKEDDRYLISPSEVADLHLISYEVERDLIPLILSNCQYSMEKGGETLQDFDLERIQQQVISKFLQGKPLITLTGIPALVYRHDRNYEQLFNDVRNKLDQSALPSSVMNTISGELQSYSDVCDALSITEITLGFLAMAGENAEMLLTDYIEKVLQMGDQANPHVLQALRRCHLKHNIALWQLLSTRKSEQLLRLKRDPFVDVSADYKAELSPEIAKILNNFLVYSRLEIFLQELHEMIILKLRRFHAVDEFRPTWSLKESLVAYLDTKDSELAVELEEMFPEEILLSQAVATWRAAALFRRARWES